MHIAEGRRKKLQCRGQGFETRSTRERERERESERDCGRERDIGGSGKKVYYFLNMRLSWLIVLLLIIGWVENATV